MARAVYAIPITPRRENGANDLRFFIKQRGSKTTKVTARRVSLRGVSNKLEKVSASTMLKARQARKVLQVVDHAGIQEDPSPMVLLQASR
mmetsp:Transcript_20027/g.32351  ORF Transcript_20027/g.32351 Transcript_20027/m.32351 type:complete len:90 (+) Transcript_20027:803-1072(+)